MIPGLFPGYHFALYYKYWPLPAKEVKSSVQAICKQNIILNFIKLLEKEHKNEILSVHCGSLYSCCYLGGYGDGVVLQEPV